MNIRRFSLTLLSSAIAGAIAIAPLSVSAWNSRDGTLEIHGFLDNTYHHRDDYGITKERVRGQIEWSKIFKPTGLFSEISFHGTLRATYDGVYDLNDDTFGKRSGGPGHVPPVPARRLELTVIFPWLAIGSRMMCRTSVVNE